MLTILIIAVSVLCVSVLVLFVLTLRIRKYAEDTRIQTDSVQDNLQKTIDRLKKEVSEDAKTEAARVAEVVFAKRGEEIVSAQVCEAMKREHMALAGFLRKELESLKIVQDVKIDQMGKVVAHSSGIVSRVAALLRKWHFLPKQPKANLHLISPQNKD